MPSKTASKHQASPPPELREFVATLAELLVEDYFARQQSREGENGEEDETLK